MNDPSRSQGLAARALAPALRHLEDLGHDVGAALEAVGIAADVLDEPDEQIDTERFDRMLMHGATITGDPDFGLRAGEHFRPGDYGLLEALIGHSDVTEMPDLVNRFHLLLGGSTHEPLEVRGDEIVYIPTDPNCHLSRTVADYSMVSGLTLARLLLRGYDIATWASFAHPAPSDTTVYERVLACELRFDAAENAIAFPSGSLPEVSDAIDRTMASMLLTEATARLEQYAGAVSAADRVRAVLRAAHGNGYTASAVAYQLAVSERTLRRQLAAEETTFADVRDEVRHDEAVWLLQHSDKSVTDIAIHLGFGDTSGFHRAFKRWTGTTPAATRDQIG
ncbi:MAG: AraC family transcriptional regulator, partial [Acidimicrobiia bacterium]|nr:AraC family transcriptional regulator [Acidimicrobiia bacterium]